MLPEDAQIISGDDHAIEHPDARTDRLPSKYKEAGARIVRQPDGNDVWVYEDEVAGNFPLNAVAGKDPKEFALDPRRYDDLLPGCHDIHDQIKDMDLEGIWAQLCFPNMDGFAGSAPSSMPASSATSRGRAAEVTGYLL